MAGGDGGAGRSGLGLRKIQAQVARRSNSAASEQRPGVAVAGDVRAVRPILQQQPGVCGGGEESTGRRLLVVLSAAMIARQGVFLVAVSEFGGVAFDGRRYQRLRRARCRLGSARRLPVGAAVGAVVQVEGAAQGAGSALVGGEDGGAAIECLLNLWGQRGRDKSIRLLYTCGERKKESTIAPRSKTQSTDKHSAGFSPISSDGCSQSLCPRSPLFGDQHTKLGLVQDDLFWRWPHAIGGVLLISGLVWAIAGCGESSVVPVTGGAARGLVLTDSVTDQRFNVAVSDGVLALTDVDGTGTVLPDSGLIDQATGIRYSLAVTRGALTLAPSLNVTGGLPGDRALRHGSDEDLRAGGGRAERSR